jgi:hypothetical protein
VVEYCNQDNQDVLQASRISLHELKARRGMQTADLSDIRFKKKDSIAM